MDLAHIVLELRTGRDGLHTPENAAQLFSTLPDLKNNLWYWLLGQDERLSFEIIVDVQTIYFQVLAPRRLAEYLKGLVVASYPEAIITELGSDPVSTLWLLLQPNATPHPVHGQLEVGKLAVGSMALKNHDYLPLKTYHDFKDVDPLTTLLSTLSKTQPGDQIVVQFLMADGGEWWKRRGFSAAEATPPPPQKALIEKKLNTRCLKTAIKIAVVSPSLERSNLLLETIGTAFSGVSLSESNQLNLRKTYFAKQNFLRTMAERSFFRSPNFHLSVDELATLYHLPNKNLATIPNIAWGKNLLGEPPENLPVITRDSDPSVKKDINPFARTVYKNTPAIYGLKRADRRRHMYVIGKTGTGKSTLLANMAINDLKNDEGLCVIDPHGDLVETILNYIPSRRINDVVYFDPADPERTVKINLFEGKNVEHRELIASGIVSVFQKLYAYSWGPRLEYILRNALLTLLKSPQARMSDITELLTNYKFRAKVVESLDDPILRNFWINEFDALQDRQRNEAVAPILNKVGQFVSSPLVRDVVNAQKSSFDIDDIMNEGKILLVNLSQGRLGEDNATLLGAMLITKIQLSAMSRVNIPEEQRRDFFLYVDEFQNFATESFNKILSEARKYRLDLILANQYIAQIPEEVQKAIFGNCGTIASFVMGADDAGVFEKEYGGKYTHEDLVTLSKYQIINKITIDNVISLPFPAMTLPLAKSSNQNRNKVVKVSRERYATKK